jgi:hypothetical protein
MWTRTCLLAVTLLAASTNRAAAQTKVTGANVPEDRATAVLHVNVGAANASDENPGTEKLPLQSISRATALAVANNAKGVGTRIRIAPGMYRDRVDLPYRGKKQTDAPIVFEATEKGKSILSGADIFTDWRKVDGEENIYWHAWPHKWGPREQVKDPVWIKCGIFYEPILLRKETAYCNGQLLKLVLSPLDLREGTMYVSEEEEKLIVWLPRGLDARTALMEVPVRAGLFRVRAQRNIVLRGLVVQHDNSYYGMSSAVSFSQNSQNIVIEDCRFEWNNCGGYGFNTVREVTVRRVVSNYNGGSGAQGSRLHNVLFEDTENSYNNWRGHWGEFYGWSVSGTKFLEVSNAVWRRNRSFGNYGFGFWFDIGCHDIVMDACFWARNTRQGIFIEANQGPITIQNSVIAFNGGGVMSTNSQGVTLAHNVLYGNASSQICPQGKRDRPIRHWSYGGKTENLVLNIRDWNLTGNVVVSIGKRQTGLNLAYADPELFIKTLASDGNIWFNASASRVFMLSGVPMNLAEWRSVSGQDRQSRFADPRFADPGNLNFLLAGDSPRLAAVPRAVASEFDADQARKVLLKKQSEALKENWRTPFPGITKVKPNGWAPLDLRPHANRPLRGEGGWMGVGGLSLDWLAGGRQSIQGVPFDILDPTDGKLACIALRSSRVKQTAGRELAAKVVVPVGRKVRVLHFLHGCGWAKSAKVGQYRILYEDGGRATVDIIPYASGSEHLDVMERMRKAATIQDWWPAVAQIENDRLRHVIVANPENIAQKRYLYNLQWTNPKPDRVVKAVELESNPAVGTSIFVVALTAGLAE